LLQHAAEINEWQNDDKQGYSGAIELVCESEDLLRAAADALREGTEPAMNSQAPTTHEPFVDSPVLQAKRRAFDNPTQANLDALIAAVRAEPAVPLVTPEAAQEQYPIPLNAEQERWIKHFAADDRLWTTQETVEFNLRVFARFMLKAALVSSPAAAEKEKP
jgi:hypothetical protein